MINLRPEDRRNLRRDIFDALGQIDYLDDPDTDADEDIAGALRELEALGTSIAGRAARLLGGE